MPPIVSAAHRAGIPTWAYRIAVAALVSYIGWSSKQIYSDLHDGTTASAQTAQRAVGVAVAAKASIATVQTNVSSVQADVAALKARSDDDASTINLISQQIGKLTDVVGTEADQLSAQTAQLAAVSTKLDDLIKPPHESVGQLVPPLFPTDAP